MYTYTLLVKIQGKNICETVNTTQYFKYHAKRTWVAIDLIIMLLKTTWLVSFQHDIVLIITDY